MSVLPAPTVSRVLSRHPEFGKFLNRGAMLAARLPGGRDQCPLCETEGRFANVFPATGVRRRAKCPRCGALERHRLQALVLNELRPQLEQSRPRVLHIAPEPSIQSILRRFARLYNSGDFDAELAELQLDLRRMPEIADESYDLVYASHVLEHIDDDQAAISEIWRVLTPGGLAILPVPIIADETVEYSEPCPAEAYHVRAPGVDYFDRLSSAFKGVKIWSSDDFSAENRVHVEEDRSYFPTPECPERPSQIGRLHTDFVPVCEK